MCASNVEEWMVRQGRPDWMGMFEEGAVASESQIGWDECVGHVGIIRMGLALGINSCEANK